jgi:hypothetical protein
LAVAALAVTGLAVTALAVTGLRGLPLAVAILCGPPLLAAAVSWEPAPSRSAAIDLASIAHSSGSGLPPIDFPSTGRS